MAVTFTELEKAAARQRASTLPMSSVMPHQYEGTVSMSMPQQYRNDIGYPVRQHAYSATTAPGFHQSQYSQYPTYDTLEPYWQRMSWKRPPMHFERQQPPPVPPKTPIEEPSSPHDSIQSCQDMAKSRAITYGIIPDQLPPHSNPQALSQSQSEAFSSSQPLPPLRLGKDEVWNSVTGIADYSISRQATHLPYFMSTKPLLTVTKTSNGLPVGTVRFHAITSNSIGLTIHGLDTSISHSGLLHNRWAFQSTTSPSSAEKYYWKKDKKTGGAVLEDAKRSGTVLARMKGDLVQFEKGRLSEPVYDEIVMSAIAMAEAARRQKRRSDIQDIGAAVGDFTTSQTQNSIESAHGPGGRQRNAY